MPSRVVSGIAAAGVLVVVTVAAAEPAPFRVAGESTVRFRCFGPKVTEPAAGRFGAVSGQMRIDPMDLKNASGALQVVLRSIHTRDASWDRMFRAAAFLGLTSHPTSTFEVTAVQGAHSLTPNQWTHVRLRGRFTLHGVTRDTTARARLRWLPAEASRKERIEVQATVRFRFRDHEIWIPRGSTETFAGIGAEARAHAFYERR